MCLKLDVAIHQALHRCLDAWRGRRATGPAPDAAAPSDSERPVPARLG